MKERPILFSAPMIRALLAGSKTQTRRVMKRQKQHDFTDYTLFGQQGHSTDDWKAIEHAPDWPDGKEDQCVCPYASRRGDRLWVREAFGISYDGSAIPWTGADAQRDGQVMYRATFDEKPDEGRLPWKPSIHMPRWASRILLEVTELRVQRLQEISEADALAEGSPLTSGSYAHRTWYRELWNSINGAGSWASNPWVWVVEFRRIQP